MKSEKLAAETILKGTGISVLDAARMIRNILDFVPNIDKSEAKKYCFKIIEAGRRTIAITEMNFSVGLSLYIDSKRHLRADSIRDIKYLSRRLIENCPQLAKYNFSELKRGVCEEFLTKTFITPSQFNKARTMLHALFEFALRREWCEINPIRLIEKKRVIEKEIIPLSLSSVNKLLYYSKNTDCAAAVGILIMCGLRPTEVSRLKWGDIDFAENLITVRANCSKTGGTRQVEICSALKKLLLPIKLCDDMYICPKNWLNKWRKIRRLAGIDKFWVQDVLRHTYASYHAKLYRNLPKLQLNMGHRNHTLLYSRYVNMRGITYSDAYRFFN